MLGATLAELAAAAVMRILMRKFRASVAPVLLPRLHDLAPEDRDWCISEALAVTPSYLLFSFFCFRFSLSVNFAFFCVSFLPLSFFPLSPIFYLLSHDVIRL